MVVRSSGRVEIVTLHGHSQHVTTLCESQASIGTAVIARGTFYTSNCVFVGTDSGNLAVFLWQPSARRWSCVGVVPAPPLPTGFTAFKWSALEVSDDTIGGTFASTDPLSGRFLLCGVLQPVNDAGATAPPTTFLRYCDVDHTFTGLNGPPVNLPGGEDEWPMFNSILLYSHTPSNWAAFASATVLSASVSKIPPLVVQLLRRNDVLVPVTPPGDSPTDDTRGLMPVSPLVFASYISCCSFLAVSPPYALHLCLLLSNSNLVGYVIQTSGSDAPATVSVLRSLLPPINDRLDAKLAVAPSGFVAVCQTGPEGACVSIVHPTTALVPLITSSDASQPKTWDSPTLQDYDLSWSGVVTHMRTSSPSPPSQRYSLTWRDTSKQDFGALCPSVASHVVVHLPRR